MLDITGKRFLFFLVSGILIVMSIISLATFGLRPGIEFSSGSMMTVHFEQEVNHGELRQELASIGYGNAIVQSTGKGDFLIRTGELSKEEKAGLRDALASRSGNFEEKGFYSVSPMAAAETVRNAGIAIAVSAVGILLYITWAFRKMPNPFHYGTCAIIALGHDALIPLGIFSILGHVWGWEINLMFITGILAVVGYSVNDTCLLYTSPSPRD